ncbi:MAG: hypothetical protein IJW18_02170 [Lachnospiraceae bacterium]|nr:hypothetical protein [Lachnospiraceae bacterium]
MDCGGDFFCEINGIDYCDGNHDMTCFGTGLVYPPIEEKGYFDKCELCNATGFLDACEYCRNGNFTILPAGGSVECGLCKSNKGTEHEGMYDAGYAEPIYELKQDDKMPFIQKEELIEVEAELRYQYINRIALYKLKTFSVLNKALEKEMFIYENPLESIGEVCATAVVYTGDEDDFERAEILLAPYGVQGVDLSAGEHYYFANLEDKVIECASEVEYKNRLETDRNKAAEFIYKNSWSRNDYLSVVLDDNEYMFLDNTKVNGCIIEKNQYLTTAADSEYAYGYACECADIDDINSMRLISETSILSVKEEADTEALYTTAIEAEVELCMGMVSAKGTGQTLYSGKSYYGNKADNIYNHVMYREGYGINHNGGDPDDGYNIVVAEPIEPCVIVRNNDMTKETKPSGQLVDVMDTDYQLLLDSFYYIQISENINEDKYAKSKFIKFPFTLNYNGIYYYTRSDGYTDWIEIEKPKNYLDEWNLSNNEYVSNNHWQMMPIYIPAWAEETDTTDNLPPNIIIKVIDKKHKEYVAESSVQVSGIIYGFTVTGISDISQYKGIADKDVMFNIVYPAVLDKLEWVSGGKNRFGDNAYRYLLDGSLEYNVESWQTLPIRKGSGDGNNTTKSGSGELSKGTSFNYIIRTIANMTGENDYIEIVPRFKYVMEDGSVINDEDLIIIYNLFSDTYVVAGSEKEKQLFGKMSEDLKSGNAEYISCMLAPSLGDDGYKGILDFSSVKSRYLTNIFGYINIPNELRVLCGETKELSVNRFNEPEELLSEEDMNMDGITDEGFNNDSFRTSMQMWFGSYKIWEEFYCVDKRMYPDFFEEGVPVNLNDDERILTNGKLVIGFEIIAYKNGKKHLVYADMWQTEGQECYTVSEYMNDVMGDEVMIDYGDVAVVDTSKKLSDSKDTRIYIID